MGIAAGIDVGNSTTEVVLTGSDGSPIAWDRAPTRGPKGSTPSWEHAVRVLTRLERRTGERADVLGITHQQAVATRALVVPPENQPIWPLANLGGLGRSPGRAGYGVGRPADLSGERPAGPVVVVVRPELGFRRAVDLISGWINAGVDVVGVAMASDEAVLLANRIELPVPVLDEANVLAALQADLLAIEVAEAGHDLQLINDAIRLAAIFKGVPSAALDRAAMSLTGVRAGLIGRFDGPEPTPSGPERAWIRFAGSPERLAPRDGLEQAGEPLEWFDGVANAAVADWFAVDLDAAAAAVWARPGHGGFVVATMEAGQEAQTDPVEIVSGYRSGRIVLADSEPAAARIGALTTPGAAGNATVLDLGAGTVDAMAPDWSRTKAGGGELLTLGVGASLGLPRGAADWVKRGPAGRLEGPHVIADENGERRFLDQGAPPDAVGSLVVAGPAGLLPFHRRLALAEWRALRLRLKADTLGRNIVRALAGANVGELIVVGGPAGDEELLAWLRASLPGVILGRGDVAGSLGHRWAVAYGLSRIAAAG